jgi:fructose-bisphosphate aldolase class II
VPQELQDIINANGGALPQTYGVPIEEILKGIKHGVRKVNIDTDLRLAATGAVRKVLHNDGEQFDPRKYLAPTKKAMEDVCLERFEQFMSAGKASKIKVIPLSEMAKRYANGDLDQKVSPAKAAE